MIGLFVDGLLFIEMGGLVDMIGLFIDYYKWED